MNSKFSDDFLDFRSIGTTSNLKMTATPDKLTLSGLNTDIVSLTSLDGIDITANTLKVSTITSSNVYVSGITVAPSISSLNINTTNITITGTLLSTGISAGTLSVSGPSNLQNITATTINSTTITNRTLKSTTITTTNLYVSDSEYANKIYGSNITDNQTTFTQLVPKIVGSGQSGTGSMQGFSVSISSVNGDYIAVGGFGDGQNSTVAGTGATWLFVRSGPTYVQTNKLVGAGSSGNGGQGYSVAIDSSGLTLIVGAPEDNTQGALWMFERSGSTWSETQKIVSAGLTGTLNRFGQSVSLSGDSLTLAVGADASTTTGATLIFTRSALGQSFSQTQLLIGTGIIIGTTNIRQGYSVALSSDSNYLAVGGRNDNISVGAVWIFVKGTGGTYTQQQKLVGTGGTTTITQGFCVSLNSDGSYMATGAPNDNSNTGAVWVFIRTGSTWTQLGTKIVGTGSGTPLAAQGTSVILNPDASTLLVGGRNDTNIGSMWTFVRTGTTFSQQGYKLYGTGYSGTTRQFASMSLSDNGYLVAGGDRDASNAGAAWVYSNNIGLNVNNSVVRFTGRPAFRASSCPSTFTVNASSTIVYTTAIYNVTNSYSTSTGLFTAPVSGIYLFETGLLGTSIGQIATGTMQLDIGSYTVYRLVNGITANNQSFFGKVVVDLLVGQTIGVLITTAGSAGTITVDNNSNGTGSWFTGVQLC